MLTAHLPREAETALNEAITCYKGGGYRAGLLFSYLAFSLTLRHRILGVVGTPPCFAPGEWTSKRSELTNEDKWDKCTFEATQSRGPKAIFLISDDLRQQILYWKDRRNDCAHFKDNDIGSSHVESFWAFIRSNLGKFVPVGSRESVLQRLVSHFDPNLTPPGQDPMPIVREIPSSVEGASLPAFFMDLNEALLQTDVFSEISSRRNIANVHDCIMRLGDANTIDLLLTYLKREPKQLLALLDLAPGHVQLLHSDPQSIRKLWREQLFSKSHRGLRVYSALLRNNLIPDNEKDEANGHVALSLRGEIPAEEDVSDLQNGGFFHCFAELVFATPPYKHLDDFDWGNKHARFLVWYIEQFGFTDDNLIRALCSVFRRVYHPTIAANEIRDLFQRNTTLRQSFQSRAQQLSLGLPDALF